jgi:hypothetical protein
MPLRAANVAPTTADETGHHPEFWEADVRRVEGIALWALTRFEKAETALLRALEVAHAVGEEHMSCRWGFMAPLLPPAKLGGGCGRTSLPCRFFGHTEASLQIAQRALRELARLGFEQAKI